ncbi:uncharacterized protein MONOS_6999 [Monocercomonoides exilis]|uniref:uncharacterized protein n=1 Tax=Monocercomonoides exilis TaxID=2049356 RepID=UPI00355A4027|nr:hypothetical protein MONOS_6999 [Monocercomonoides exilis]|eukprot:MONOS_6999.1-p1 / transcript=MONOS_6999.1 / gene=MONOS_6999 / organism=Monocercomonoides_exilis_PA203 / gene_product=unspecified product / transcript_product=unspecified product / location=Mono_scaffold00230:53603-55042(-) / protein_length=480 / sequence_SO=supercontig / SO=protein_coding / is_pseudo=false
MMNISKNSQYFTNKTLQSDEINILDNSIFYKCVSAFYGGFVAGLFCKELSIKNCTFFRCTHNCEDKKSMRQTKILPTSFAGELIQFQQIMQNNATFEACTFNRCYAISGGALYYTSNINVQVKSCLFTGCSATEGDGGAVFGGYLFLCTERNQFQFTNFSNCSSHNGIGGGVYCYGSFGMQNCIAQKCRGDDGGFLALTAGNVQMNVVSMKQCEAVKKREGIGGGIFVEAHYGAVALSECVFEKCSACLVGGGMGLFRAQLNFSTLYSPGIMLDGCRFKGNQAAIKVKEGERYYSPGSSLANDIYADSTFATIITSATFSKKTTSSSTKPRIYVNGRGDLSHLIHGTLSVGGIIGVSVGALMFIAIIILFACILSCATKNKLPCQKRKEKERGKRNAYGKMEETSALLTELSSSSSSLESEAGVASVAMTESDCDSNSATTSPVEIIENGISTNSSSQQFISSNSEEALKAASTALSGS